MPFNNGDITAKTKEREGKVPRQNVGAKTNSRAHKKLRSTEGSSKLFREARNRLFDINHWQQYSGKGSGKFILTDESGNPIFTKPKVGNLIKIELPGPKNKTGDGYEWVRIEAIEINSDPHGEWEMSSIRVRPTKNPGKVNRDTAHFYTSDATSTFIVERKGKVVTASEHGRNEIPNTKVQRDGDKIRNALVSLGAMIGLAKVQWKKLVKGLLDVDIELKSQ